MAVTLTVQDVRDFISTADEFSGTGDDTTRNRLYDYLPGWLETATEMVTRYAPDAPDSLHDRAVQMIIEYWVSSPTNPARQRTMIMDHTDVWHDAKRLGNALRYSGAMALLTSYRRRRAL